MLWSNSKQSTWWKCCWSNKDYSNCDILQKTNIQAKPNQYVMDLQLNKICSIVTGQIYFGLFQEAILLVNTSAVYSLNKRFKLLKWFYHNFSFCWKLLSFLLEFLNLDLKISGVKNLWFVWLWKWPLWFLQVACPEWSFVKYRYPKLKANNEEWAAEPHNSNCILLFQNKNKRQPRKGNQAIKKGSVGKEYPKAEFGRLDSCRLDSKPEKVAPWYILATNLSLSFCFQIRTIESILKSCSPG